jgi:hypothetical protein
LVRPFGDGGNAIGVPRPFGLRKEGKGREGKEGKERKGGTLKE